MVTVGSLIVTGDEPQAQDFSVVPQIAAGQLTFQYIPKAARHHGDVELRVRRARRGQDSVYGTGKAGAVTLMAADAGLGRPSRWRRSTGDLEGTRRQVHRRRPTAAADSAPTASAARRPARRPAPRARSPTPTVSAPVTRRTPIPRRSAQDSRWRPAPGAARQRRSGRRRRRQADAGVPMDASASDAETINPPDGGIVATAEHLRRDLQRHEGLRLRRRRGPPAATRSATRARISANLALRRQGDLRHRPLGLHERLRLRLPEHGLPHQLQRQRRLPAGYYCNGNTNACAPPRSTASPARPTPSARSNHCAGRAGVASAATPLAPRRTPATTRAPTGKCQCPGVTCNAGVACEIFYQDADGDGYGNKSGDPGRRHRQGGLRRHAPCGLRRRQHRLRRRGRQRPPGPDGLLRARASKGIGTFDYDCDGTVREGAQRVSPAPPARSAPPARRLRGGRHDLRLVGSPGVAGLSARGRHLPVDDGPDDAIDLMSVVARPRRSSARRRSSSRPPAAAATTTPASSRRSPADSRAPTSPAAPAAARGRRRHSNGTAPAASTKQTCH